MAIVRSLDRRSLDWKVHVMRKYPQYTVRGAAAGTGVFMMLAGHAAGVYQPQQFGSGQGTFRSSTTLVQVDVMVHDDKGNFVPGLRAEDVTILEDGKPQRIQQFYLVTHGVSGKGQPTDGSTRAASATDEEHAQRVFILMFDEGHLANESLMRVQKGAEAFIAEQLGPTDFGGVFANGAMFRGRLTTSKTELLAGVRSVRPAFENRQTLLAPFREFPRIPSEIDAARISDGARELADSLAQDACRDEPVLCQIDGGLGQVENLIERKSRQYVRQARVLTASTIQNLQHVAARLSRMPGRKTLVLLSEGFFIEESRALLKTVAAQAARGGTTIYSIDGRGLIHGMAGTADTLQRGMGRSTSFDTGEDGPNILAAATGGLSFRNIDDIARAFSMIERDTSSYYVVGYQADNAKLDNTFRKIEVRTRIRDVNVRARKGYIAK